ncbi:transport between ER and Golgi ATPase protein [Agyrium rufum]|nr:transport between ER and Golgi ATPase protein [Agyrium rufum]
MDGDKSTPYDAFIRECGNNAVGIQNRYEDHRTTRNEQQKAKILAPNFAGIEPDETLVKLEHPDLYPGFVDERHNLVFWARPTQALRELIGNIQRRLRMVAPDLWLMPLECLHMTVLEIVHSTTQVGIEDRIKVVEPKLQEITDFTYDHPVRLVKPMLGFDASALALTFVPADQSAPSVPDPDYTYHHLRADLYKLCRSTGVEIASRYTVSSAHLTVARMIEKKDFGEVTEGPEVIPNPGKMKAWISTIESLNQWLQGTYWPHDKKEDTSDGEWIVGREVGLDLRTAACWYGGGYSVRVGKGS